jgi:hypothetical protein
MFSLNMGLGYNPKKGKAAFATHKVSFCEGQWLVLQ